MKTTLWTVDFDLGFRRSRLYVSASTVLMAVKNAVRRFNKDGELQVTPKQITMVRRGRIDGEIIWEDKMKTTLWTVDFDNGMRMYVSASTILVAVKNAVWGYNRDSGALEITAKNVTSVRKGKI